MINAILVMMGTALVLIGSLRAITSDKSYLEDPSANHSDRRIVLDGGTYWIEEYHAMPGWSRLKYFQTLDEAKTDKARWDAIHKREEKLAPTVVVPQ